MAGPAKVSAADRTLGPEPVHTPGSTVKPAANSSRIQSLSYERFQFWVLGEIFIETLPGVLIPNARRDGFEDSPAWREMQDQIRDTLKDYIGAVYKASGARSSKRFEKVKENADREIEDIQAVLQAAPNTQGLESLDLVDDFARVLAAAQVTRSEATEAFAEASRRYFDRT